MERLGTRRKARELALKALYMLDVQGEPDSATMRRFWKDQPAKPQVRGYAEELFKGVVERLEELDRRIASASEHWRIDRMGRVDRNILRVAVHEMLYIEDVPPEASIDEAVEIARRYGDNSSPAFVNGILDCIWKEEERDAS